jgi:hypothetical protein
VEENSRKIYGVELCSEGFSKIRSGGSGRIIGENWTRVVGFPLTALDKIGVAMGVGCTFEAAEVGLCGRLVAMVLALGIKKRQVANGY